MGGKSGEEREREREVCCSRSAHLYIHLLVDSCMCPDQGLNPQPWPIGTTL